MSGKVPVLVFPQTGVIDLGADLQGLVLPSPTQSLADSESQRGRVAERRWKELGRARKKKGRGAGIVETKRKMVEGGVAQGENKGRREKLKDVMILTTEKL